MPGNQAFRFAVGSIADVRSSVWTLAVHRSDVILAARLVGKVAKFTFHESHRDRLAFHPGTGIVDSLTGDRAIRKWTRPPSGNGGWSLALGIIVPPIRRAPRPALQLAAKSIAWIEAPEEDERICFYVAIAGPGWEPLNVVPNDPVCGELRLANGGGVVVAARRLPVVEAERVTARLQADGFEIIHSELHLLGTADVSPWLLDLPLEQADVVDV